MHLAPLVVPLLLVPACGDGADTVSSEPAAPGTSLAVEYTAAEAADPQRWTVSCDPVGGDHPRPAEACSALAAQDEPLAPLSADAVCTEQYGGPQTAVVRGTYRGRPVDLRLSRVDGCHISQWDRLVPLVPAAS